MSHQNLDVLSGSKPKTNPVGHDVLRDEVFGQLVELGMEGNLMAIRNLSN